MEGPSKLMCDHERRDRGTVDYNRMPDDELYLLLARRRPDVAAVAEKIDDHNRQTVIAFLRVG